MRVFLRLFVVGVAAAAALVPLPATLIERTYSRGAYPLFQPLVTAASSLIPIALLDLAAAALLAGAMAGVVRLFRQAGAIAAARRTIAAAAVIAAILYLWFLAFWGLNYRRLPLEEKLAYDPALLQQERARQFAWTAVGQVNALAAASSAAAGSGEDDAALAEALAAVERQLGGTRRTRVAQPKRSVLTWYFRTAALDGMTNPFFLEIILNRDLLRFERPFVLAHEWAHLAGYADESEANFVAWLTCLRGTPLARYSGWLSAYQHVQSGLPREDRQALRAALGPTVVADLAAAYQRFAKSSAPVRAAAQGAYDTYLRANRIEEGIRSYDAVVRLMLGTSFDDDWTPRLRTAR